VIVDGWGVVYQQQNFVQCLLTPYLRARGCALAAEEIYAVYRKTSLGRRTAAEFWTGVGLAHEGAEIERDFVQTQPRLAAGALEALARLRADYRLGLLSNDVTEWAARVRARCGIEHEFDQVVISADAGLRKPDPRIYRLFLERAGVSATDCVFVDDRAENLAGAAALGIRTIHLVAGGGQPYTGAWSAIDCIAELPDAVARVLPPEG
jgi:HAD superfamily hydrolase (TIGR01509 family)